MRVTHLSGICTLASVAACSMTNADAEGRAATGGGVALEQLQRGERRSDWLRCCAECKRWRRS